LVAGLYWVQSALTPSPPTPKQIAKAKADLEKSYVERCAEYGVRPNTSAWPKCRQKMIDDDALDDAAAEDSRPTPY
jgi:hypothetical protein